MSNFTSPAIQAMNLIRYIGDEVSRSGKSIEILDCAEIQEIIGAPSDEFVEQLIEDLKERGTIKGHLSPEKGGPSSFFFVTLTLNGWSSTRRKNAVSSRAITASSLWSLMTPNSTPFVKDVVKPAVKEGIGYDLVDMRDVGVPESSTTSCVPRFRDAAFVIVDLTHDNSGPTGRLVMLKG